MNAEDILQNIGLIIKSTLNTPHLNVTRETTAADAVEWDSLSHIKIIVAVEKHYHLRFALSEIHTLKNVGDLVDLIERKSRKK